MRHDINHHRVFATPDSLTDDFALIFQAIADAFRGMSGHPLESRWSRLRSCDNC